MTLTPDELEQCENQPYERIGLAFSSYKDCAEQEFKLSKRAYEYLGEGNGEAGNFGVLHQKYNEQNCWFINTSGWWELLNIEEKRSTIELTSSWWPPATLSQSPETV